MRFRTALALTLVLALGLLSGCGKSGNNLTTPGSGGSNAALEESEVSAVLAQTPEVIDDAEFETAEEFSTSAMAIGDVGTLDAIRPLRWWRGIRSVERRFEFAFADTDSVGRPITAIVTVHKRLRGNFNIIAGEAGEGDGDGTPNTNTGIQLIQKPLDDHWIRRILLKRVHNPQRTHSRWRVVASSSVEVTSRDATTDIQSLRVQTADFDTTITNPRAFWYLRRLVRVNAQDEVKLTVTTSASDDVVFLFSRAGRFRFRNNGDGTYSGTWHAPRLASLRHVGVNALSNGTLFDDKAPYDSNAWILPYVVTPNEVAEYLPEDGS